jgi:hypothetical protein
LWPALLPHALALTHALTANLRVLLLSLQSFDPHLQLHTLLYDDGDLEQLNLSEEQWELLLQQAAAAPQAAAAGDASCRHTAMAEWGGDAAGNSPGEQQQKPPRRQSAELAYLVSACDGRAREDAVAAGASNKDAAAAPAPAAAEGVAAASMDIDVDEAHDAPTALRADTDTEGRDDDAAWLAAAEAAAAARPLRVMWDSHACMMRVIAAADLVAAELEMRRQQRQMQQQGQQSTLWQEQHGRHLLARHEVQQRTSSTQPPLLQCQNHVWEAAEQQPGLAAPFDPVVHSRHHLPPQLHQHSQQQQQRDGSPSQQWQCGAGEEAVALLPGVPETGPATFSTSSSEATADRQHDSQVGRV